MRLKKGDQVIVTVGKDKGRKGKIEKVFPQRAMVLIPGINIYKKHVKPRDKGKPGGIIDVVRPMCISKVALLCPKCGQRTRVGWQAEEEKKERICKKCKAII